MSSVQIEADTVEAEAGQARHVKLDYQLDGAFKLSAQLKPKDSPQWQDASLACATLQLGAATPESLLCRQGRLRYPNIDLPFSLDYSRRHSAGGASMALRLEVQQASVSDNSGLHATDKLSASLEVQASQGDPGSGASAQNGIAAASLAQSQAVLGQFKSTQPGSAQPGSTSAAVDRLRPSRSSLSSTRQPANAGIASTSTPARTSSAISGDAPWRWQAALDWRSGEAFWQPFYLAGGGHRLSAQGTLDAQAVKVQQASLDLHDIGQATLSGQWRRSDNSLQTLRLDAPALHLNTVYPALLKPLLGQGMLADLDIEGEAGLQLELRQGELYSARLDLRQVDLADRKGGFALYKLDASLPWRYDAMQPLRLSFGGGSLLKLPLGAATLQADIDRYALTAATLRLPILDGALQLDEVSAAWAGGAWHGHLRASVQPIDMVLVSRALGWPRMEGKVAASIPMVTYSAGQLGVDGAMGFNLFQGSILVDQLALQQPLGLAPRLSAKLQMRDLDLGALTRTFAFGAIEGKLDGDVNDLQLLDWKPVHFDAAFYSSPGRYPKKISQRAVENISALGGAGAAAAIQRSVLRFFKEFNYQKIGLSCRLRDSLCQMDGVESTAQGYVIVKGSGVPAITVMGYNHSVNWAELLARLQRITAGNVKPVIE